MVLPQQLKPREGRKAPPLPMPALIHSTPGQVERRYSNMSVGRFHATAAQVMNRRYNSIR